MIQAVRRNLGLWGGVFFALLAAAVTFAPATSDEELTPVAGRVTGTWKSWRQHGWVLATDRGPVRVRVARDAWGGETELRSAGILEGDRVAARIGRDLLGRPDGDMWEIVVNGDTVLTCAERRARADRAARGTALTAGALALFLGVTALVRRRPRREEPPALPRRSD